MSTVSKRSIPPLKIAKIEFFYKKALKFIDKGDLESASKVIYIETPPHIFDLSLDILFNRNPETSNDSLRKLIVKVDGALNNMKDKDVLDLSDNFGSNF
jgi:hypothetical protein